MNTISVFAILLGLCALQITSQEFSEGAQPEQVSVYFIKLCRKYE